MPRRSSIPCAWRVPKLLDHTDLMFEVKHDGWRGVACCEDTATRLVSRHGNVLRSFKPLAADITAALGRCKVLDGQL